MEFPIESAALALAAASLPGVAGFALPLAAGFGASLARRASAVSALLALLLALGTGALYLLTGPQTAVWLHVELPFSLGVGIGARVDGLTCLMLLTVTLIGAVVTRYAVRYLDGDADQARFCRWLSYTLSAVLVVIVSSNLAMLLVGWIGTSHGLHQLLTHFRERPAALLAARKKFLISRLGDALLLVALALIARCFGTLEFAEIFPQLPSVPEGELLPIALLLVLGAMTKSAQFPFHTWLPDSMETPTPVSALMHAGIINAGGFLLIRMSPLLAAAPAALVPLALGGAVTALLGSVAMLAQTDVKRKYAYSTVAQMGFMMLQCGLGAFAAAALHMVGHAFYKGHAFLAAGSVVDPEPPSAAAAGGGTRPVGYARLGLALAAGFGLVLVVALVMGVDPSAKPGLPVLGSILALAAAQLLLTAQADSRRGIAGSLALGAFLAATYFAGVELFENVLGAAIPAVQPALSGVATPLSVALVALFAVAFAVQHRLAPASTSALARAAYVHASNGFYLGSIQNRLVARLWPSPKPSAIHAKGAMG